MQELQNLIEEIKSCEECRVEEAVRKIASYGSQAIPHLKELLLDPNPDLRWWAAWALAEIKDPQAPVLLIGALQDPSPQVRQAAALALRHQPSPEAVAPLVEALKSPDSVMVRLASAALVATGSPAVEALLAVIKTGDQQTRMEAVRTLALIGDQRAIPALFESLQGDSALMEFWASEGLERMGLGLQFFKP